MRPPAPMIVATEAVPAFRTAPQSPHAALRPSFAWLLVECLILFAGVPLAYLFGLNCHPVLLCGVLALAGIALLLLDKNFSGRLLWNAAQLRSQTRGMLLPFACTAAALALAVALFAPERFLLLPRTQTHTWAVIMLSYPLLSVYPQEVIYRAFFFHRYRPLFGTGWPMIVASAAMFSLAHILFRNALAVVLTFAGGILFAWRYRRSGSTLTVATEHALYGNLLFTIGLGEFFCYAPVSPA